MRLGALGAASCGREVRMLEVKGAEHAKILLFIEREREITHCAGICLKPVHSTIHHVTGWGADVSDPGLVGDVSEPEPGPPRYLSDDSLALLAAKPEVKEKNLLDLCSSVPSWGVRITQSGRAVKVPRSD